LLEKAGPTAQMKLADKTYLLSALDELYQLTGDSLLLSRAGEIAATFTVETAQTWFDPRMYPMLPDLAIALHYYGWLAEDKPAKDAARYITDHLLNYGPSLPVLDQVRLVYANEIVHSKCIHAAVIGAPDDPKIPDFLSAALEGWDPRKIAQALDPTTDAELIDAKGYSAQTSAVTYICIDDVCYAPCRDAAKIKETIEQAVKDLQAEVNGMSAPKSAPAS
jgi:hypothetical protein